MVRLANKARRKPVKRELARALRTNSTDAERKLWCRLRRKQMNNMRFRRQQPVGPYVADFLCASAKLIVELDGSQHGLAENIVHDAIRTRWLEANGYQVLRFPNEDVFKRIEDVLYAIDLIVQARTPPRIRYANSTLPQGEG